MTRLSYKWKPGGSQARGLRAKFLRANSPRGSREHRSSFPAKTPPPSNRHSLPQNFASMRGVQSNAFSWRHSDDQPYHERTSPAENARQGGSNEPLPLISPSAPLPTQSPIHQQVTPQGILVTSDRTDDESVPVVEGRGECDGGVKRLVSKVVRWLVASCPHQKPPSPLRSRVLSLSTLHQ